MLRDGLELLRLLGISDRRLSREPGEAALVDDGAFAFVAAGPVFLKVLEKSAVLLIDCRGEPFGEHIVLQACFRLLGERAIGRGCRRCGSIGTLRGV